MECKYNMKDIYIYFKTFLDTIVTELLLYYYKVYLTFNQIKTGKL
jgi:hypothetical protein